MNQTPLEPHDDDIDPLRRVLAALLPAFAFTGAAQAQDASKVQPRAYKVAFENDKLRVLEYHAKPGMGVCGQGLHSHPAHLTMALADGKVRVRHDGKVEQHDVKAGTIFWSEAETHEVENVSGRDMRAYLVELKAPCKG